MFELGDLVRFKGSGIYRGRYNPNKKFGIVVDIQRNMVESSMGRQTRCFNCKMDALGQRRKSYEFLPRTFGGKMSNINLGDLVRCIWLDKESIAIALDYEQRPFYSIFKVYDFYANEYYWVDEDDLKKL